MKIHFIFFITFLSSTCLFSQNNNSPYSFIGIGDIEKSSFDRTSGMGNAGVALSFNRFILQSNPAALARLDDHFFNFETNARYNAISYSGKPITNVTDNASSDVQFKKITLAIKLKSWVGLSIGLLPFSTANYSYASTKTVQGGNFSSETYNEGAGGTNQFYIAGGFKVLKDLSIGVQANYLFGQINQKETLYPTFTDSVLVTDRTYDISRNYIKFGIQYKRKINKNWVGMAGATSSFKTKISANYNVTVKDGNSTVYEDGKYIDNFLTLPSISTIGIAAILKDKFTFAADYNYQGWSGLNKGGLGYSLENCNRISIGAEYAKKYKFFDGTSMERFFFQTGFIYNTSYLKIYGQQIDNIAATFGAGLNSIKNGLGFHAALEVGRLGTTSNGLIKQNYTQLIFTLSYRDFWFTKVKKYD